MKIVTGACRAERRSQARRSQPHRRDGGELVAPAELGSLGGHTRGVVRTVGEIRKTESLLVIQIDQASEHFLVEEPEEPLGMGGGKAAALFGRIPMLRA